MNFIKSIRIQLILFFVIISLVSSVIVSSVNYVETEKLLNERFNRQLDDTASLIKMNIEGNLADIQEVVARFVRHPSVKKLDREKINEISAFFLDYVNLFYNIYVYDRDGSLISVLYFERESEEEQKGHKKNFRMLNNEFSHVALQVISDGNPRFTKTFSRRQKLLTAYVASIPGANDGEPAGLVSCGIFVNNPRTANLLKNLVPTYSGFICLLDREGNVYASEGNIPETVTVFPLNTLQQKSAGPRPVLNVGGQSFRYSLEAIGSANLFVLVAMSDNVVRNLLSSLAKEVLMLNVFSFVIALLISTALAHIIVKPINNLVGGLREVGKGNYNCRVTARSFGEMEEAINSFNEMTEKLQKKRMIEKLWDEQWKEENVE